MIHHLDCASEYWVAEPWANDWDHALASKPPRLDRRESLKCDWDHLKRNLQTQIPHSVQAHAAHDSFPDEHHPIGLQLPGLI